MIFSCAVEQPVYHRTYRQVEEQHRGQDNRAEYQVDIVYACAERKEADKYAYDGQLYKQHSSVEYRQLKVEIRPRSLGRIEKEEYRGNKAQIGRAHV